MAWKDTVGAWCKFAGCRRWFLRTYARHAFCQTQCRTNHNNPEGSFSKYKKEAPRRVTKTCKGCSKTFSYTWPESAHRDYCHRRCAAALQMREKRRKLRASCPTKELTP